MRMILEVGGTLGEKETVQHKAGKDMAAMLGEIQIQKRQKEGQRHGQVEED